MTFHLPGTCWFSAESSCCFFFVLGILHPYRRSNRFLDCRSEMPTSLVRALSPFLHVHRALVEFSRNVNFTRCFDMFLMACLTKKWNHKMGWMGWHDEWHLATLHNKERDVWIQKAVAVDSPIDWCIFKTLQTPVEREPPPPVAMGTTLVRQPYCIVLEAGGVIDKLLHLTEFLPTRSWGTRLLVKCLSWALVAALHAFLGNFKTTQLQRDQPKLDTHHRWLTHWRVWSFGWNKTWPPKWPQVPLALAFLPKLEARTWGISTNQLG